jgi:hypothetical protein
LVAWRVLSIGSSLFFNNYLAVDRTIEKIERLNLVLVGVGALAGWSTGVVHVPSFLLGGGIMQANFWLLKKTVRVVLSPSREGGSGKARAAIWFLAKGAIFLLLLSALFIRYPVQPGSFALGVSLLLLTCVIVTLSGPRTDSREVLPDEKKILTP